jgi:hypothetical protein
MREWKREAEAEKKGPQGRTSSKKAILSNEDEVSFNNDVHLNFDGDDDDLGFEMGNVSLNEYGDEIPVDMGFSR